MIPIKPLFSFLEETKGINQNPKYHPEGDVFNHSLQVLRWAFRETNDIDLILAAMLHDVGKIIDSNDHPKIGIKMLDNYCSAKTLFLIEHHLRIRYFIDGEMKKLSSVKFLYNHPWFPELILLSRWDKLGRNPRSNIKYDKDKIIENIFKKIKNRGELWNLTPRQPKE